MSLILTLQEYMTIYPERLKNGRIFCECGASNIRIIHDPADMGDANICAVCNKTLFVDQNKPLEAEEV